MPRLYQACHLAILLAWIVLCAGGCAGGRHQSTRLTDADLNEVVGQMSASLTRSDFLDGRDRESLRAVIVINRVENLTSDVLTSAEQWMLVARVSAALPIQTLLQRKNVVFQIAPERHALLEAQGFDGDAGDPAPPATPTHTLWATFRSTTRSARRRGKPTDERNETYYLEYRITQIASRQTVWIDSFTIKREAVGLAID